MPTTWPPAPRPGRRGRPNGRTTPRPDRRIPKPNPPTPFPPREGGASKAPSPPGEGGRGVSTGGLIGGSDAGAVQRGVGDPAEDRGRSHDRQPAPRARPHRPTRQFLAVPRRTGTQPRGPVLQ